MERWGFGLAAMLFAASMGMGGCVADGAITVSCEPGSLVSAGCGCMGLGRCGGDPVLLACDGAFSPRQCLDRGTTIGSNDDSCGLCPYLTVTCPTSGSITFATRPYSEGNTYTCDLGVEGATREDPGGDDGRPAPPEDAGRDMGTEEPSPP